MSVTRLLTKMAGGGCHVEDARPGPALPKVLVVGSPNVGKSLLFNRLTGRYVTVSNYPGTTVDVSRGVLKTADGRYEVVDTPGMYSLAPITDEERVSFSLLVQQEARAVIHVIDAKNIRRMLGLSLQLAEAGLPLIVALNMADEARELGVRIDAAKLQEILGVPVVETVATTGRGFPELIGQISAVRPATRVLTNYGAALEEAVVSIAEILPGGNGISARTRALLLLQEEEEGLAWLRQNVEPAKAERVLRLAGRARGALRHSVHYYAAIALKARVEKILADCATFPVARANGVRERLSRMLMRPVIGVPVLLAVLYAGLYKFVGSFGAGVLVDFLQETVFSGYITPPVTRFVGAVIPWPILQELFVGEYGIVTLGIRYAVAIILPIVSTFFIAFSILEDSGYLPRMAMLIDRAFKKIGLTGRAVIPMVLGFGCDTMATMVTRTLETRREKIILTLLLALTIPCSAQIGVILGLLQGRPAALLTWAGFMVVVFVAAGGLLSRVLPGEGPSFYMELPPLRVPSFGNVAIKTYTRVVWYFKEVFPLFILASLFIWVGRFTGLFDLLIRGMTPLVNWIGLPDQASTAFLFGFFRRDYGAAGLYDLQKSGALNGNQLTVAVITITLFLPCVAQFLIMKKERGMKMTLLMSGAIFVLAFSGGFAANTLLNLLGITL